MTSQFHFGKSNCKSVDKINFRVPVRIEVEKYKCDFIVRKKHKKLCNFKKSWYNKVLKIFLKAGKIPNEIISSEKNCYCLGVCL